jgi:hypothetical protein
MDVNLLHGKTFGSGTTNGELQYMQSAACKISWTRASEENGSRIRKTFQRSPRKSIRVAILQFSTNSTFNSVWCAPPKSVHNYNDSCIRTEWPSSTHILRCRHARKNWRVTRFPPPSVLLGRGEVPYQWSWERVQLQDLGQLKSTCHMWVGERDRPKVNMWAGLIHFKFTGLFSFSKNCDRTFVLGYAGAVCAAQITTWDYPPNKIGRRHISAIMWRITWTERRLGRGIGRGRPIAWHPRSSDLTPLNILLWGYVKNTVYQVKANYLQHLKACIRDAVASVTPNLLQATWNDVEYRLDICRATSLKYIRKLYTWYFPL